MIGHHAAWELLPDIAAGTYESHELADVEAHLADCPICRVELESLRETVHLLSGAPALLDPPPGLRERVLAIPREVPAKEAPARAPQRAWKPSRRWWPAAFVGSATAVAALAVGLIVTLGGSPSGRALPLQPPPKTVQPDAWGRAQWGHRSDGNVSLTIKVGDLSRPADGFYEVWFGKPQGSRHSVGTFTVPANGEATVTFAVPQGVSHEYQWLWITRERDDGNPSPSHDTVLVANLA
jgi:hypothetical protein